MMAAMYAGCGDDAAQPDATRGTLPPDAQAGTFGVAPGVSGNAGTFAAPAGSPAPPTSSMFPVGSPPTCDAARDGDADGTPDCRDMCPADRAKTAPGACGCGMADTDGDRDGTPDCKDGCPQDPSRAPAVGSACAMAGTAGTGPMPMPMPMPNPMPMPGGEAGACPAGFTSDLPLVMTGSTVPGNLELGLASAPETPRNPCGLPEEQECFNMLNAERVAAGRAPLLWDGDLVDIARSHAADRNQQRYPGSMHGSSTNAAHLYEQRGAFLGLKMGKFKNVVENALTGGRTASSAVKSWMGSSGHRAVIMGDGQWATFTYAGCGRDGLEWNIEFGR